MWKVSERNTHVNVVYKDIQKAFYICWIECNEVILTSSSTSYLRIALKTSSNRDNCM